MRAHFFTKLVKLSLLAVLIAGILSGGLARLDPYLGIEKSAFTEALADENDPVARAILLRAQICNPSGQEHDGNLPHKHCDGCLSGLAGGVLPGPAALIVPYKTVLTGKVFYSASASYDTYRRLPQSRAPPAV